MAADVVLETGGAVRMTVTPARSQAAGTGLDHAPDGHYRDRRI